MIMAELEGIYTIWLRENKKFLRYRSRIVTSVVTPLLWLLIFGTGLGSAMRFGNIAGGYQAFIYRESLPRPSSSPQCSPGFR